MDIYNFRLLLVNALTYKLMQTEEGYNKLKQYTVYTNPETDMDVQGLLSLI